MEDGSDLMPASSSGRSRYIFPPALAVVAIVAGLLFFARPGCPLQEPQEPRYAEIPRQMLAADSLLVPLYHGSSYLDKPPLLYWLVMASYSVFGVHDWAARLVPCTAGFLCVLVAYGWARRTAGERAALLGALMLCLAPRFLQLERMLTMDSLLCLWVVAAWGAAHLASCTAQLRWSWWLGSAVACGLGLLTKGPVALVLVAVPVFLLHVFGNRSVRAGVLPWLAYLTLAVGMAAPWYAAMLVRDPGFADYFFLRHNVDRFLEPFDHVEPVWFFVPELVLGLFPWTLLLPGLVWLVLRGARRASKGEPNTSNVALAGASGSLFFLLTTGWTVAFFSLAGCKRPAYILPALPPLALALGCYLDTAVLARCYHRRRAVSWGLCTAAILGVLLLALHELLPRYARQYSLRGVVRRHANTAEGRLPVVSYPRHWDSVSFYLERNDIRVYGPERCDELVADLESHPQTLVFVKTERWLPDLLKRLPAALEFEPQGRQGYVTVGVVSRRRRAEGRQAPVRWETDLWTGCWVAEVARLWVDRNSGEFRYPSIRR
jgi:4-amino-4-deoxy-L-arabinose transferase-like glycosyltransferase